MVTPAPHEMIQAVIEAERCGRLIAAGLGLCKLREMHETWWKPSLPADERAWRDYTAKHFPFGADRADQLLGRMVHYGGLLACSRCGTEAKCFCACGVDYAPVHRWRAPELSALERALAAVRLHPERSNRAIAAAISVSEPTVRRARQITGRATVE